MKKYTYTHVHACSVAKLCWLFVTPWTVACQAHLSMGFSWQEYWSGLPFPPSRDLPDPGIEPTSTRVSCIAGGFFTIWATREAHLRTGSLKINNPVAHKSWFVAFADFKATKLMSLNVELERISIHGWLNAQLKSPWIWGWTETFYKGPGHLQILIWGEGSWYQFLMDTEGQLYI